MAALASTAPTAQLCDYCHQKPKHGTHPYCSKTCAAQTATLCNYCQKKPKYQNFDFCGKNCAALAATAPTSGNRAVKAPSASQASAKSAGRASAHAAAAAPPAPVNPLLDPVHLAKLVVQHIPQVQSFLAAVGPAQPAAPPPVSASAPGPLPPAATSQPKPRNNPFLNLTNQTPPSNAPQAAVASSGTAALSTAPQAAVQPLDCLIPGCGQPVHVDSAGVMSDYCSKKHREEAVSSGLVSPCIMCLALPQSDADYFCGRDCREEAMNKSLEP
ncbi:hypothetical protein B0H17DRAFT_1204999 [Mycena rosella]|uniref:Uncharacterized protein n=1 Tax=Mycena rosella TaxID=1033263 RepID=A0AAD7GAQ5_MYCRO|nr:hypothetical protein B0H17DRAFT_1204999 [Mycena rosella]